MPPGGGFPTEQSGDGGVRKVRAAIVGLGRIGSLLEEDPLREKPCTHAGAVTANPDCVLVAGCDTDGDRRHRFGERWGCPVYADADLMIRETAPDILHIATHPDSHSRYCALAADRGVPVAVCEKPLADTITAAAEIAALHSGGRIRIITNHERRYAADYGRARAILEEGRLGRLLSASGRLYMGKNRRLLKVLWHDGTHLADALMFLSGLKLRHRMAWGAPLSGAAGTAYLAGILAPPPPEGGPLWGPLEGPLGEAMSLPAGAVPVLIELGAERDHLIFELEFSCETGRLRIGNGVFEVWESGPSPYAASFRSLVRTGETREGPTGYFANMAADAVRCVRERSHEPRSSALDGLEAIRYLHSVSPLIDPDLP
ncbi:MAG: Gfo/Idh/MocA family oxidoreductase [Spirochaetaceae bacterium]|jgi:predicted dehydrogenase|nr:Gfo/Idh/MocA family oxidoreductase [Spirochaetaceae bacterium]